MKSFNFETALSLARDSKRIRNPDFPQGAYITVSSFPPLCPPSGWIKYFSSPKTTAFIILNSKDCYPDIEHKIMSNVLSDNWYEVDENGNLTDSITCQFCGK